jgi:hypothetical protein
MHTTAAAPRCAACGEREALGGRYLCAPCREGRSRGEPHGEPGAADPLLALDDSLDYAQQLYRDVLCGAADPADPADLPPKDAARRRALLTELAALRRGDPEEAAAEDPEIEPEFARDFAPVSPPLGDLDVEGKDLDVRGSGERYVETVPLSPTSCSSSSPSSLVPPTPGSPVVERNTGEEEKEVDGLLRAAVEGRLEPVPVELILPEAVDPAMRSVAEFFALVRGVRLWKGDDRPVAFACGWVGRWLGLPKRTVHGALGRLTDAGVLVHVDTLPRRGGQRGTWLWAAGQLVESGAVDVEGRAEGAGEPGEPEPRLEDEPLVGRAELAVVDGPTGAAGDGAGDVGQAGSSFHPQNGTAANVPCPPGGAEPDGEEGR